MVDDIKFDIHKAVGTYLLQRLELVDHKLDANIIEILKSDQISLSKSQVDSIKAILGISNYALFYATLSPQDINPLKFRGFSDKLHSWDFQQIEWVRTRRIAYLNLLEDIDELPITLFQEYRQEILSQTNDEEAVAGFFRNKLNFDIVTEDRRLFLRNYIYSIESLGILVFSHEYSKGIDGFSQYNEVYPTIFFNLNRGERRTLFTLGHELGHLIFDQGHSHIDTKITFGKNSKEENRANRFAAFLLMPREAITEEYNKLKTNRRQKVTKYLQKLSEKFHTSEEAIFYHIKNLDIATENEITEMNNYLNLRNKSGGRAQTGDYQKAILQYGIFTTFKFIVAKNDQKISHKQYYQFFEGYYSILMS